MSTSSGGSTKACLTSSILGMSLQEQAREKLSDGGGGSEEMKERERKGQREGRRGEEEGERGMAGEGERDAEIGQERESEGEGGREGGKERGRDGMETEREGTDVRQSEKEKARGRKQQETKDELATSICERPYSMYRHI